MKASNEYAKAYPNYAETPKAVIAAVAFSLAQRLCMDDGQIAQAMLAEEWDALHRAGIVGQKPPVRR